MSGSGPFEFSACKGKEAFDRATANLVVRRHNANLRRQDKNLVKAPIAAFRCQFCGKWHTSTKRKELRRGA